MPRHETRHIYLPTTLKLVKILTMQTDVNYTTNADLVSLKVKGQGHVTHVINISLSVYVD